MRILYALEYWHNKNWGWMGSITGITKETLPDRIEDLKNHIFKDAYGEEFKTEKIRVFRYGERELVEEIDNSN